MTQAAFPFSLLEVRPCWRADCDEVLDASGERWWPFHSSLHVCPEHGPMWWLLGPGEKR